MFFDINMLKKVDIPQYLDVLLILDDKITKAKIYRILDRGKDYLTRSLQYLKEHDIIEIDRDKKDTRLVVITLTPKGKDVQNIVLSLYNLMGLKK